MMFIVVVVFFLLRHEQVDQKSPTMSIFCFREVIINSLMSLAPWSAELLDEIQHGAFLMSRWRRPRIGRGKSGRKIKQNAGFNFGTPQPIYEMYKLVENVNFTLIQVGLRWRKQQRLKIFGSMGSLVPPGQQNPSHHRWFSPKPCHHDCHGETSRWLQVGHRVFLVDFGFHPWWQLLSWSPFERCSPQHLCSIVENASFIFCLKTPSSSSPPLFFLPNRFSFFSVRWGLWVLTFCCRCLCLLCYGLAVALSLSLLLCCFCSFHVC